MPNDKLILSFCVSLDRLAQKSECSLLDIEEFYDSVYEFGRQFVSKDHDFSDLERNSIQTSYPSSVEKAAKFTAEIIQHKKPNELKMLLSSIEFLINDIYEIFKYFSLDNSPANLAENISLLQEKQENLKKLLKSVKNSDDEKGDIPNLDGIPATHDWWTQKDRDSTKDENKEE
uniref:Uncharacterized protein n=1 Tax=Panagrolaimus sp. PS1159 TaxID=55785 RepID=A0AC35F549_9BILA